jgi:L-threonylcarbamoyladenylate synthase
MKTEVLRTAEKDWLTHALDVIAAGGVVAFPTDTVYGIGVDPFNTDAVGKLFAAKGRPPEKAIPILLGRNEAIDIVVNDIPAWVESLSSSFWPGALTIVLKKKGSVPQIVSRTGTLGVRIPDHPIALEFLRASGPLAVTSANPSGAPEASNATEVLAGLEDMIDLVVDGGLTPGGRPSTVLDCTVQPPVILRQGPISRAQIFAVLNSA